ncbi:DHH family phosphoesterase [Corallococcus sp. ZKHCc1 1396]|uniref:DHH family phosphoesterase n=1 Tax=Corallococcus soli TaxID=2710757 RepID=A0ABR9PYW4_9BACT|nr:DHH family phosphoesterase [Corallococcus soli]MBE4752947.1 DHH family phosphoesterase [Corallococcus soli]
MLLGHTRDVSWPAPEPELAKARRFLEDCRGKHVLVVPYPDADGLASGVLMLRALQSLGARPTARLPGKGEDLHTETFLERLGTAPAEALVVLDMGNRWGGTLLPGVPTLVVDRHDRRGAKGFSPEVQVLTAYGHEPVANTSVLTYVLMSHFVVPGPLEWLAALGTVAALGPDAPMPFLKDALRRAKRTAVVETVSLLNAATRSHRIATPLAMQVLLRAGSASDILESRVLGVDALRDCRLEVQREVARCAKTPPRFAGNVALLLFSSETQVHPLVAVRWAQRMPDHVVIAANTGYLPGRVDFTLRSRAPLELQGLMRGGERPTLEETAEEGVVRYAVSGSLPPADFLRLLEGMGFRGLNGLDVERRGVAPG